MGIWFESCVPKSESASFDTIQLQYILYNMEYESYMIAIEYDIFIEERFSLSYYTVTSHQYNNLVSK